MKTKLTLIAGAIALTLAACSSASEKISGTYVGPYSSTSLTQGTGTGTAVVTADGSKIDILFTSPGNPDVAMNDVSVQDIIGVYHLDDNGVSGTITGSIMAITYDGNGQSISYQGNKQ